MAGSNPQHGKHGKKRWISACIGPVSAQACGQVPRKAKVFHATARPAEVVPNRGTLAPGRGTQGLKTHKPLIFQEKEKLSTAKAAFYYYHHVFIKRKEITTKSSSRRPPKERDVRAFGFAEGFEIQGLEGQNPVGERASKGLPSQWNPAVGAIDLVANGSLGPHCPARRTSLQSP